MKLPKFYSNIGFIRTVADGIVTVVGLDLVRYGEMIIFSNRAIGVVLSLENHSISAIILGSDTKILPGDFVFRTAKLMGISVSGALLGSVVNPLGQNLSNKKIINNKKKGGKYRMFKNLFSIFFLDPRTFRSLLIFEKKKKKSVIKEAYMGAFMADIVKALHIRKTFSMFLNVKQFFKLPDVSFVKTLYRSKKILNKLFDSKINSKEFTR